MATMTKPVKVRFQKIPNGNIFLSHGYYVDEADWKSRNNTYTTVEFTKITEPPVKKKEATEAS